MQIQCKRCKKFMPSVDLVPHLMSHGGYTLDEANDEWNAITKEMYIKQNKYKKHTRDMTDDEREDLRNRHLEKALKVITDAFNVPTHRTDKLTHDGIITNATDDGVLTIEIPIYGTVYTKPEKITLEVYGLARGFNTWSDFIGMEALVCIHETWVYLIHASKVGEA